MNWLVSKTSVPQGTEGSNPSPSAIYDAVCYDNLMSPFLVSFMFTAGASAWIYTKFQRYSGNNTKQSATATGVAAVFIFIVFYYIASKLIG